MHTHTHTHWTSVVCLILCVWVPSASFCSLLHSAVLSFSTTALTLSHYYPIHPLPPITLPLSSLSPPLLVLSRFLPSFYFSTLFSFGVLIYAPTFFSAVPFLPLTLVLLLYFSLLLCCHTLPQTHFKKYIFSLFPSCFASLSVCFPLSSLTHVYDTCRYWRGREKTAKRAMDGKGLIVYCIHHDFVNLTDISSST